MAPSQLKKLKASLKEHGLVGQANSKKSRVSKSKDSKQSRQEKLQVIESIREAFNPFAVKHTRQKQDISGRDVIGASGKPGLSKQTDEEARRKALQAEKMAKNRVGGIVDRRFGENNKGMSVEEKMLIRFTRERQKKVTKSSLFNLDDDEDSMTLTHFGNSLALEDDFDEGDLGVESDNEGDMFKKKKQERKIDEFAGSENGEGDEGVKKSKQEVMKEVIAKSKMYKHERQLLKEQDQMIISELDDTENIGKLYEALRSVDNSNETTKATKLANGLHGDASKDEEYESQVRELAFDRRAKPSDRTMTVEELEEAHNKRLKELEKQRQARMEGDLDENDNTKGGDDLEDDYYNNDAEEFGLGMKNGSSEESEVEGESADNSEDDSVSDEIAEEKESSSNHDFKKATRAVKTAKSNKLPQNFKEIDDILQNVSSTEYEKVIESLIKANHPRLAPGNKELLGSFLLILIDYILHWKSSEPFDGLLAVIRRLAEQFPESTATYFRAQLRNSEERVVDEDLINSDLILFSIIGVVFSTSDHFHLVVTSSTLIMCQYLSQKPIKCLNDVKNGLYLCNILLQYQRVSKRYIPEVWVYLTRVFGCFKVKESNKIPLESVDIFDNSDFEIEIEPFDFSYEPVSILQIAQGRKVASQLLLHAVETISLLSRLWTEKSAFIEIGDAIILRLSHLDTAHKNIGTLIDKLNRLLKFAKQERVPLTMQSHKPLPLITHAPKFEENYNVDKKSYDRDDERRESAKLKAEYKKERKAALRDIRKDSAFVAREKIKERRETDKAYHDKLARLERTIATEEGAEKNRYEREKSRAKR